MTMRAFFASFIFSAATLYLAGFALASSVEEGPKPAFPPTPLNHSNLSVRVRLFVHGVVFICVLCSDSGFRF
jgi:hypothetical protein